MRAAAPAPVSARPGEVAGTGAEPPGAAAGRGLYRYSVAVIVAVLLLIQAGAMVTSTGSGLAYLDWPTANGSWWPDEMRRWSPGLFEHGHRTIGALIGLLVLVLVGWTLRAERRDWVRKLSLLLLGLVVLQGLLGAKTVLGKLPAWVSASHGVLAQVFLCALTVFAFVVSPAWRRQTPVPAGQARAARGLAGWSVGLVFCQLTLGAVVRHANVASVLWLHVSTALLVTLAILVTTAYCSGRFAGVAGFRSLGRWLMAVLTTQLLLGFLTLAVRGGGKETATVEQVGRALLVTGHVVVGAVMFLLATLLLVRTHRNLVVAGGTGHGQARRLRRAR